MYGDSIPAVILTMLLIGCLTFGAAGFTLGWAVWGAEILTLKQVGIGVLVLVGIAAAGWIGNKIARLSI